MGVDYGMKSIGWLYQLAGRDYFGGMIKNFISEMAKKVMGGRVETPFSHIY